MSVPYSIRHDATPALRELSEAVQELREATRSPVVTTKKIERDARGQITGVVERSERIDVAALIRKCQKALDRAFKAKDEDQQALALAIGADLLDLVRPYLAPDKRQANWIEAAAWRSALGLVDEVGRPGV